MIAAINSGLFRTFGAAGWNIVWPEATWAGHIGAKQPALSRRLLPLIPAGLVVAEVLPAPDHVTIITVPKPSTCTCPVCGAVSGRVHSRYTRTLADLPWQGRRATIKVQTRRFRCARAACPRRIFTELWRRSRLRQVKYLNNIVEQDHRNVKRLTRPDLGFGSFWTARRTIAGYEAMAMIRKKQVRNISCRDIKAQAEFIAGLFQMVA